MSLEQNKEDFEKALKKMKGIIELLSPCLDDSLIDTLETVVTEYERHYVRDIDNMIDDLGILQETIDELKIHD